MIDCWTVMVFLNYFVSHPSNLLIQCIPEIIHGLSMDHPPSNVVATPVIRKYNVSMDYPWIIRHPM